MMQVAYIYVGHKNIKEKDPIISVKPHKHTPIYLGHLHNYIYICVSHNKDGQGQEFRPNQ